MDTDLLVVLLTDSYIFLRKLFDLLRVLRAVAVYNVDSVYI